MAEEIKSEIKGDYSEYNGEQLAKVISMKDVYATNHYLNNMHCSGKFSGSEWNILWAALWYAAANFDDFKYWLKRATVSIGE